MVWVNVPKRSVVKVLVPRVNYLLVGGRTLRKWGLVGGL